MVAGQWGAARVLERFARFWCGARWPREFEEFARPWRGRPFKLDLEWAV